MKLKYLQLSVLLAALLLGWSYAPENVSAQESLGYCDSIVEASIGPDLVVEPGETFPVSWGADYSTYEPTGGRNFYQVDLYRDGQFLRSWKADTDNGEQPPEGGTYVVEGGVTQETEFSVTVSVISDVSCPDGTSESASMTVSLSEPGTTPPYCLISSFTADNSNPAYNTGTTLRYSLDMIGSFTWNISLLNGTTLPSPYSGTSSSGTSSTGNLTQSHTYRLTCGTDFSDLTVSVASPAPSAVDGVCSSTHYNCTAGTSANNVDGSTSWTWNCNGSNGGTNASCSESKTPSAVNGVCSATHYDCSSGSSVNHGADSTQWTWNCNGSNGGANASCSEDKGFETSPSGALSATSCEIAAGSSTCNSFVTWGTQNLTSGTTEVTRNNPANTHVSFATSGNNALNTIRYGVTGISTFFLYHNIDGTPIILAQDSVTASCSAGSIWDGSICKAIPEGMSGTLTPASPSCDIALSKSSCIINFSWNTINPVDTSKVTRNPANTIVATGNSGTNVPFTVKYDIETFFLYNNAVNLATSTVTSSCVSGTEWNGVRCIAGVSAIDGVCSATHYNCLPGISVDKVNGLNSWTWYCNGLNGGNRSPQCSESKNPGAIDGVCSVTHYNCSEGISNNNISGLNSWTWTCDGSGGGTNAACFEKYRIPTFIED